MLTNTGSGCAAPVYQSTGMGAKAGFYPALLVDDIDADGDLDVIYSNHLTQALYSDPVLQFGGAIAVFRNDGAGNLGAPEAFGMQAGKPGFADMKLADVTGDGTFGPRTGWYMGSCGTFDLELYDLEGDGDADGFSDVAVVMGMVGTLPVNGSGVDILLARPACAGSLLHHGQGLGGTNGVTPVLDGSGCSEIGGSMSVDLVNGLPNATSFFFAGTAPASVPVKGGSFLLGRSRDPRRLSRPGVCRWRAHRGGR